MKSRRKRTPLIGLLFAATGLWSAQISAQQPGAREVQAVIERSWEEEIEPSGALGLVVSLVKEGSVLFSGGFGLAEVAAGTAMTDRTPVRVGSVSRPVAATGIMRLVESGNLDLDADALSDRIAP
jgi:CubicO group peptidase (beta-lactamase class C family)